MNFICYISSFTLLYLSSSLSSKEIDYQKIVSDKPIQQKMTTNITDAAIVKYPITLQHIGPQVFDGVFSIRKTDGSNRSGGFHRMISTVAL